MNNSEINHRNLPITKILVLIVLAGILYVSFSYLLSQRLAETTLQTEVFLAEQKARLSTIAEITARSGADEVTEKIVQDCPANERVRFDNLLSALNSGLNRTELIELERLFGRCGNFFSQRKAVMAARFQREIEIYETFVQQLENLSQSDNTEAYQVSDWKALSDLELKQSELFSDLVQAQDEIITLLLEGKLRTSPEVEAVLVRATQIQETLVVTNAQATDLRTTLVSL